MQNQAHYFKIIWFLGLSIFAGFLVYLDKTGFFSYLYKNDPSTISFWIILLIVLTYVYSLREFARLDDAKNQTKRIGKRRTLELQEHGFFVSELCQSLGLAGTIYGLIQMLSVFVLKINTLSAAASGTSAEALSSMLIGITVGMSTALLTTMVGLTGSIFLKIQYFLLNRATDEIYFEETLLEPRQKLSRLKVLSKILDNFRKKKTSQNIEPVWLEDTYPEADIDFETTKELPQARNARPISKKVKVVKKKSSARSKP